MLALYWDRIDWVRNNIISDGVNEESDEARYLTSTGVLTRTQVTLVGNFNPVTCLLDSQSIAIAAHERKEPGVWSLAMPLQTENQHGRLDTMDRGAVELLLFGALPVPPPSVPIDQVLDFKHSRRDELALLRQEMDDLCCEIRNSADPSRSMQAALLKMGNALADLNRVYAEKFSTKKVASLSAAWKAAWPIATGASVGATVGAGMGFPVAGAVAGASLPIIERYLEHRSRTEALPDRLRPYRYAYLISAELHSSR